MSIRLRLTAIAGLSVLSLLLIGSVSRAQEYRLSDFEPQQLSAVPPSCGCGELGCDACGHFDYNDCGCSSSYRPTFWLRSDYLMWWTKGNRMPPLVTTSPNGTDRDEAGVLGFDTTILHGGERVDANFRNGVRYRAGMWLDACSQVGVDVHYLYLDDGANTGDYFGRSLGDPILARPFFNTQLNAEDSQLIAFPGVVQGQIDIQTSSEMHSAGILLRRGWWRDGSTSIDLVGGYRYFRYREGLSINENLLLLDTPGFPNDTTLDVRDTFTAENDFHGGEIGINSTYCHRGFVIDLLAKVAVGNVHQDLEVRGQTVRTVPNSPPVTDDLGFLALPTNIGQRTRNRFAFLPEVNLDIRYPLTHSLQLTAGYSLLYLTKVVRSGDQVDTVINPSQFPQNGGVVTDPIRPAPLFQDTAIWAQGLNLGIEWVY
jgi:hypothetical protein